MMPERGAAVVGICLEDAATAEAVAAVLREQGLRPYVVSEGDTLEQGLRGQNLEAILISVSYWPDLAILLNADPPYGDPVVIIVGEPASSVPPEAPAGLYIEYAAEDHLVSRIAQQLAAALRQRRFHREALQLHSRLQQAEHELRIAQDRNAAAETQLKRALTELRELSIRDGLTKLYNHGYFLTLLEKEVARAQRCRYQLSCLIIDIDYFKNVNESFGHLFGEQVLLQISALIIRAIRGIDYLARYGGEEFGILLLETNYAEAVPIAERIRSSIEDNNFLVDDQQLRLTVSIGVSSLLDDGVLDKERLLSNAELSLYEAKVRGRNMVLSYRDIDSGNNREMEKLREVEERLYGTAEISRESYLESVKTLVNIMEEKDAYTREHSINVLRYATLLAKQLGLPQNEIQVIGNAAILHDLGKIAISDRILLKNGKLSRKEYENIKEHPLIAVRILRRNSFVRRELDLILHHHERWDGTGYPRGIAGKAIPLGARIICVADSYDAMRAARPFRKELPIESVLDELVAHSGTQFDGHLVHTFFIALQKYELLPSNVALEPFLVRLEEQISAQDAAELRDAPEAA